MRNPIGIVVLSILLLSCKQDSKVISSLYAFPEKLKEVSGIAYIAQSKLLWVIEDSGNANIIYGLNPTGKLEKSITIQNAKNIDWEDITKDKEGNLYIGDFGNNENKREDLCIYKIEKDSLLKNIIDSSYKVSFVYPEQKKFPPKKKNLLYDVEAFFEFKNNFYLFTKNRSSKFDGTTFLYKVPNRAGFHQAKLLGEFKTGGSYENNAITSATISPDASKVLLLCHSKVWLFQNFTSDNFLSGKVNELQLHHFSQKEAICFKDNSTLLIADEKSKKTGGFVYETTLERLEAKP
jgi:hypothetical protein